MSTEFKVASILDNRRLVINAGTAQNVNIGDKFMIYGSQGQEIKDPDSNEVLGNLEIAKIPVEIVQVEEKFSVGETFTFKEKNEGGAYSGIGVISNYLTPPKITREYDTFDIDSVTRKAIDEAKSIIKVGDIARKITLNRKQSQLP